MDGKRVFVITPRTDLALELDDVDLLLKRLRLKSKVKGNFGIAFEYGSKGEKASLLASGLMIVESSGNEEWAKGFYSKTVVDGLGVPHSEIG